MGGYWGSMSEENVALVRELFAAFKRRDHESAFEFYDPEIEWDATRTPQLNLDMARVYHGHDGVRTYWRGWLSAWRDIDFELEGVRDGGDEIVGLVGNQRQWGRHSGIETTLEPYSIVYTIRDG